MNAQEAREDAKTKGFTHVWSRSRHIPIDDWSPYEKQTVERVCLTWDCNRLNMLYDMEGGHVRASWKFLTVTP